jgi:hypothetical protein
VESFRVSCDRFQMENTSLRIVVARPRDILPVSFLCMLTLGSIRFRARCPHHPDYNPLRDADVPANPCNICVRLAEINQAHRQLVGLIKEFGARYRQSTVRKALTASSNDDERQISLFDQCLQPDGADLGIYRLNGLPMETNAVFRAQPETSMNIGCLEKK